MPNDNVAWPVDRQGLIDLVDRYLAALVAHDPGMVPLADDVRTVENIERIRPGEGLWGTATGGPTRFAVHVPDPVQQSAGFLGVLHSDRAPILLGLRLQTEGGRIVEAEHLIASNLAESNLPNLHTPRPDLLADIPRGQQLPRQKLIDIAATYYDAVEDNDGSRAPFAPSCERHENGLITAGSQSAPPPGSTFPPVARDAAGQLDSKVMTYIGPIENRRVFAADPPTGLAMGLSQFRHPMDNVPYEVILPDGTTTMYEPPFEPFDTQAAHIFKIGADGLIHAIEAMGFRTPYNAPTGWE